MKNNILRSLLVLLILSAAAFFGLNQVSAPDVLPADGPADQFSSERAVKHVEQIAAVPHPTGSAEAAEVRDYLLDELKALGVEGQVQEADSARFARGSVYSGHIQNVIGRLEGTEDSGKAILIAAHYDSVPTAPGASDDGAAVGAMLETLRALKEGPQLKHDVIFLFTDGEEAGLLGANAFVNEHPWAKDVGLVLNFEARGYKGPSFMFETSDGNSFIMNEFTKAAEHPVANSMLYDMYKLLPNDTDLTVFKGADMNGLNFAYAIGLNAYHNRIDTVETMDPESLQHHGSYMLSLTKHFGMLDSLDNAGNGQNQVYFNVFKHVLVDYSQTWVIPISAVVTIMFLFALITGLRSGVLRAGGLLKGFLGFLLAIAVTGGVAMGAWMLVNALQPDMTYNLVNDPDFFNVYSWGFALLSIAVFTGLYIWIRRWSTAANLMGGSIILFWLLTLAVTFLLPGGSYLFAWPLFFSLIGWYLLIKSPDGEITTLKDAAIQTLLAVPAVLLFAPIVYLVLVLVSLSLAGVVFALLAIMMGLLVPHVLSFMTVRTWRFPTAMVVSALVIFLISGFALDISGQNPTFASVIYGKNDDSGKAVFATATPIDDPWLEQFLTTDPKSGPLSEVLHPLFQRNYMYADAPEVKEAAPKLEVLSDKTDGDVRTLSLKITSQRGARDISVSSMTGSPIIGGSVWGKAFESEGLPFILNYTAAPDKGLELTLQIKPAGKVTLNVEDTTYGFPNVAGKSYTDSPDTIMAMKRVLITKKHEL